MLKKVLYKHYIQNIIDLFDGAAILQIKNSIVLLKTFDEISHSFYYFLNWVSNLWIAVVLEQVLF